MSSHSILTLLHQSNSNYSLINNIITLNSTLILIILYSPTTIINLRDEEILPLTSNSSKSPVWFDSLAARVPPSLFLSSSLFFLYVQDKLKLPICFPNVIFIFGPTLVLNSSSVSYYSFTISLPHLFKSYFYIPFTLYLFFFLFLVSSFPSFNSLSHPPLNIITIIIPHHDPQHKKNTAITIISIHSLTHYI